jgi:hypothetical protein
MAKAVAFALLINSPTTPAGFLKYTPETPPAAVLI